MDIMNTVNNQSDATRPAASHQKNHDDASTSEQRFTRLFNNLRIS